MIDYNKAVIDRICRDVKALHIFKKEYTAHRNKGQLFRQFTPYYQECGIKDLEKVFKQCSFPYNSATEYNDFVQDKSNTLTINDGYNEWHLEAEIAS